MDTWKFLAGLGLFLYGMTLLEKVLKKLSGRSFKLFLGKFTQRLPYAITGGALITGLLQSSSVVSLLVLALVEAGTITFRNALGIILGSNVGSTLTSWIVATIGFKIDIESYASLVVGIFAIGMFFVREQKRLYNYFRLFFSLGILFMGLGFMKTSGEYFVNSLDFETFSQYGLWIFVMMGFAVTILMQSSSATVAITLTALYTGAIMFPMAAAVVIGSELGTTIKLVLASLKGTSDKKRVAWGNFIFNFVTCAVAFIFLSEFIHFIQHVVGVKDPLIGLVFFQTLINIFTIIFFVPLINLFSNWLSKRFKGTDDKKLSFISANLPVVPDLAVEALLREGENLLTKTLEFLQYILHLEQKKVHRPLLSALASRSPVSADAMYVKLKQTEGAILEYYTVLQINDLDESEYTLVNQYVAAVRYCIRAAKTMKDIQHNFKDFDAAADDILYVHYKNIQKDWKNFHGEFQNLLTIENRKTLFEELASAMSRSFHDQQKQTSDIIEMLRKKALSEFDVSTLMNVHHEILSVKKSLLRALAHLKLTVNQSEEFEFVPEN